jgi:hypothetical protein
MMVTYSNPDEENWSLSLYWRDKKIPDTVDLRDNGEVWVSTTGEFGESQTVILSKEVMIETIIPALVAFYGLEK